MSKKGELTCILEEIPKDSKVQFSDESCEATDRNITPKPRRPT
jgi:hypothetical protein